MIFFPVWFYTKFEFDVVVEKRDFLFIKRVRFCFDLGDKNRKFCEVWGEMVFRAFSICAGLVQ